MEADHLLEPFVLIAGLSEVIMECVSRLCSVPQAASHLSAAQGL